MKWNDIPNLKTPETAAREWLESTDENGSFSYTVTDEQLAAFAKLSDTEKLEPVLASHSYRKIIAINGRPPDRLL